MSKKNIIRLTVIIVVVVAALLIALWLAGVFDCNSGKTYKINDMYEELNSPPGKIEVDMQDSYDGKFTVEDAGKIEQIYNSVMAMEYDLIKTDGSDIPPGSNKFLDFIYPDGKVISLSTRYFVFKGKWYWAITDNDLKNLLITIGLESGSITKR